MKKILNSFKNKNILIVGDLILDRYLWGTVDRISPEAPIPVVNLQSETLCPGGAANVAYNIKSLGGNPILISVVGRPTNDKVGAKLVTILSKNNISLEYIGWATNWKTPIKTRVIAHNQQVVRIDDEQNNILDDDDIIKNIKLLLKTEIISCSIISDYVKNTLTETSIRKIINLLKSMKIPIIVDSKRKSWSAFAGATIITPNVSELKTITNIDIDYSNNVFISNFMDIININHMLLTMGEKGMRLYSKGKTDYKTFKTTAKQVYDVSGAGDTVVAALALGLNKNNYVKAINIANIAAGIVVEKIGTATVTVDEIKKRINE